MTTSPHLVVAHSGPSDFLNRLPHVPGLSVFFVPGYLTLNQGTAWLAGRRDLFDEIVQWCDDTGKSGRVWVSRSDPMAMMVVAIETSTDAVMFKLRWSEHLDGSFRYAA